MDFVASVFFYVCRLVLDSLFVLSTDLEGIVAVILNHDGSPGATGRLLYEMFGWVSEIPVAFWHVGLWCIEFVTALATILLAGVVSGIALLVLIVLKVIDSDWAERFIQWFKEA